jgi:3-methyladenine DNA glycosylase AlkD
MNVREARALGHRLCALVCQGKLHQAELALVPVLEARTRFPLLGTIGLELAQAPPYRLDRFLDVLADRGTEGGWVVVGAALGARVDVDLEEAFRRCRHMVMRADIWYGADILGERVPGPALLQHFGEATSELGEWREDPNRWVRRCLGVAVHFWAKRSKGRACLQPSAAQLLSLLEPLFSERDLDAVKGIGWGLKTIGRHYPALLEDWLRQQVVLEGKPYRALMFRKATSYLPGAARARLQTRAG